MAAAGSDDDSKHQRSHPLEQERPGVYVQVVSPRRRKRKSAPLETESDDRASAVAEVVSTGNHEQLGSILDSALDAQPKRPSEIPSGERDLVSESSAAYAHAHSENSNGRNSDLVVVTLPPPPRVPNFVPSLLPKTAEIEGDEVGPSVLEAPVSAHPEEAPVSRAVPWPMVALVAALSAIIASALVVAYRDDAGVEPAAASEEEVPAEPAALAAPVKQAGPAAQAAAGAPPATPSAVSAPAAATGSAAPSPQDLMPTRTLVSGANAQPARAAVTPAPVAAPSAPLPASVVKTRPAAAAASSAPTPAAPVQEAHSVAAQPVDTAPSAPRAQGEARSASPERDPAERAALPDNPYAE